MKLIDVSVPIDATLATYPHNTPFSVEAIRRQARGDRSNLSTIHMSAHTGTHVDAPAHVVDGGAGVEALPLEILCGRARVIEVTSRKAITADDLERLDLTEDIRLLIKTYNSRLWGDPTFHSDYIGIAESAAKLLVHQGVKLVGIDYLSVEPYGTEGAPTHQLLLGAGMVVIEGLNLRDVDPGVYEMYCLPLAIVGCDGAPARVVLRRS
jgi:arylformamidase